MQLVLALGALVSHQDRDLEKQYHEQGGEEGLHLRLLARDQQQLMDGPGDLEWGECDAILIVPSTRIGLPGAVAGVASE